VKGRRGRRPNTKNKDYITLGSDELLLADDSSDEML